MNKSYEDWQDEGSAIPNMDTQVMWDRFHIMQQRGWLPVVPTADEHKSHKVLSIGVRNGYELFCLNDMGYVVPNLYGLDISRRSVASALITTDYKVFLGDIQEPMIIKDGIFDLILCMHTLEHCVYPERALENIRSLLNHAGKAIIVVPREPDIPTQFHAYFFSYLADFNELLSKFFHVQDSFVWSDVYPVEFCALIR